MSRRLVRVLPDGIELATGGFIPVMTDDDEHLRQAREAVIAAVNQLEVTHTVINLRVVHAALDRLIALAEAHGANQHCQRADCDPDCGERYDAAVAAVEGAS